MSSVIWRICMLIEQKRSFQNIYSERGEDEMFCCFAKRKFFLEHLYKAFDEQITKQEEVIVWVLPTWKMKERGSEYT